MRTWTCCARSTWTDSLSAASSRWRCAVRRRLPACLTILCVRRAAALGPATATGAPVGQAHVRALVASLRRRARTHRQPATRRRCRRRRGRAVRWCCAGPRRRGRPRGCLRAALGVAGARRGRGGGRGASACGWPGRRRAAQCARSLRPRGLRWCRRLVVRKRVALARAAATSCAVGGAATAARSTTTRAPAAALVCAAGSVAGARAYGVAGGGVRAAVRRLAPSVALHVG